MAAYTSSEREKMKREIDALRKKDQENRKKIKELEDENQKNNANLRRTILQILQKAGDKIAHPVLTIMAASEGFSLNLENHGKIFVRGVIPEPYQEVALTLVNGVVTIIKGAINCIKSFFQYLVEWVQGKLAIKNE
uniref:Uncharacterized protein n=1 Tax=Ciona intestinalis TaxID=7719 RepID=F6UCS5_CIOIN